MFNWLKKQFQRDEYRPLSLDFRLDRSVDGKHIVQIVKTVNGEEFPVNSLTTLSGYGYQEIHETSDGRIVYRVNEEDRQILLSLRSTNPKFNGNGHFLFDFAPPILSYLRTKGNIAESESSEKLQISDQPLEAVAAIDLVPGEGITVKTGFREPDSQKFVATSEIGKTADGKHVLVGDTFTPLPAPQKGEAKKWWDAPVHTIPTSRIPEFFLRDLVLLKKEFTAVLTDMANQIQIITEPFKPIVKVEKNRGGWLDFEVKYSAGDLTLPHNLLLQTNDQPYLKIDDTTWVKNNPQTVNKTERKLKELEAELTANGYRTPVSQFASLDDFIRHIGGKQEAGAAYQAFLKDLSGFRADDSFQLSPAAEKHFKEIDLKLRPYQRGGIHWLDWLQQNYLHGLLADDMGLGKTLQSICILRLAYERTNTSNHSLVLAPKSVLHHWEREINRFYPGLQVYAYHGSKRNKNLLNAAEPIVFISTYETVSNDLDQLKMVPFFYLILDEATRIKNPQSKRTQATKALNAAHRLCLSGTPVENRPSELWSIFDFLMRGHLGKYGTFQKVFENEITAGNRKAANRLGKRVRPFMLRRLKEDVAKDLPEKIDMDEWCELSLEQRQLYGGLQDEVKKLRSSISRGDKVNFTVNILPILQTLKMICDHPALINKQVDPIEGRSDKFDRIVELVQEIRQKQEQVVIFSHFLGMLSLLGKAMNQRQIGFMRIDGQTTNRQMLIDQFNNSLYDVALCSLGATSQGINLTSANHVIHADRWWNPAIEDQATDRVHRIGQDKTVYVYRVMVQGTLEERIETLLESKRKMSAQIVGAAAEGSRQWTKAELLELLRPLDE